MFNGSRWHSCNHTRWQYLRYLWLILQGCISISWTAKWNVARNSNESFINVRTFNLESLSVTCEKKNDSFVFPDGHPAEKSYAVSTRVFVKIYSFLAVNERQVTKKTIWKRRWWWRYFKTPRWQFLRLDGEKQTFLATSTTHTGIITAILFSNVNLDYVLW